MDVQPVLNLTAVQAVLNLTAAAIWEAQAACHVHIPSMNEKEMLDTAADGHQPEATL